MSYRAPAPLLILVSSLLAAGCGFEHTSQVIGSGNPVSPSPTTPSSPSLVGTWTTTERASTAPSPALPADCRSVTWKVASQTLGSATGSLTATCGSYSVEGTANGVLDGAAVSITVNASGTAVGLPACGFAFTATGVVVENTLPLAYAGTTCFGRLGSTITLRRVLAPASGAQH